MARTSRDAFTSTFGVLAATLGSAVGLGNIWKFPSLTGANGGAGFLVVYLLATLLVGLPVMIAETMLGRAARANTITAFERLSPPRQGYWTIIGWMGCAAAVLILAFYSEVAGWVYAYVFKSMVGEIATTDPKVAGSAFGALISDPFSSLLWQWVVLGVTGSIIMLGVSKGIEAVTRKLMPLLFILLLVLCVRSLTLPAAAEGLAFLFAPDLSKITPAVLLTALGLSFFKLSIGMGTMLTYGSYFRDDQNIPATTTRVMLADLTVSLLAGIAIFPAVFSLGFDPAGGPALLFNTIPAVFAQMPMGHVLMVLFFVLTTLAATGALLSLIEVPVAALNERLGWSRKTAIWVVVVTIIVLGAFCALSFSTLQHVALVGKRNIFDSFDFAGSKVLMPIAGMLTSLFVSLRWGKRAFVHANSNAGILSNTRLLTVVFWTLALVSPVLIGVVMYVGLRT